MFRGFKPGPGSLLGAAVDGEAPWTSSAAIKWLALPMELRIRECWGVKRGCSSWLSEGRRWERAWGSRLDMLGCCNCGIVLEGWRCVSAGLLAFQPAFNLSSSTGYSAGARTSLGPAAPGQPKACGPGLLEEVIVFLCSCAGVRNTRP